MKTFYYLKTCSTCSRIMKELNIGKDVTLREIKSTPLSANEVDQLAKKAGSYEALFSRRSQQYKALGLKDKALTEADYRHYLLEHYSFLKRPVLELSDAVFIGNQKTVVEQMKDAI